MGLQQRPVPAWRAEPTQKNLVFACGAISCLVAVILRQSLEIGGKIVAFLVSPEDDTTIGKITKQKYVRMTGGDLDIPATFAARESERDVLHTRYLNEQLVRVLRTIGFDVGFKRGQGQYLYDRND